MASTPLRILYDADCGFCRWSVARLLQLDGDKALHPITIQSPDGQHLLRDLPEAERLQSAHCVTPDGQLFSGGAAYPVVAASVPALRRTGSVAEAMPWLVDAGYRAVASNRRIFGRWMTPSRLAWADGVISDRVFEAQGL